MTHRNLEWLLDDLRVKNTILKSIIEKCVYKKEKSSRWNKETIDEFDLKVLILILDFLKFDNIHF